MALKLHTPFKAIRYTLFTGSLLVCLWMSPAHAQVPLYVDTFANGVVSNSDTITAFWSPITNTYSSYTETGGKLVCTAGGAGTTYSGLLAPRIFSGEPRDDFNFFKRKLRFSADVGITGDVASESLLRFVLSVGSGSPYYEEDGLAVLLTGDQKVTLSYKLDHSFFSIESGVKLVNSVNVGSAITGFDLTLDATTYTLVVRTAGGTGSTTFTGTHGIVGAQWCIDGKSTAQFETVRASAAGVGQVTTSTVDNFLVTSYAPALLFEDSFSNGTPLDSDRETAVWTATLPLASTVVEQNGVLQQTSTSTGTEYVLSNVCTPVQSRFNFFNQQLRVRATMTVTGSASQTMRGRLALASQTGTATSANDAFVIAVRSDDVLTVEAKTDASGVDPDFSASAALQEASLYLGPALFNNIDLSINGSRFLLMGSYQAKTGSGITEGCNISRFSGAHPLTRAKWGTNGDSSLMLESIRSAETVAGKVATTTWDDLRVEPDSRKTLVEPFWSFTATYAAVFSATESGTFRLWLPSTEPVIRGIIFMGPGDSMDFKYLVHDMVAQEAARAMGFGLIGYGTYARMNLSTGDNPVQIKAAVQAVLDRAAAVSGHPEISNVPVGITGLSRGSFDSCYLARNWPERVISFAPFCGGEWSNPTLSAAALKVPGFFSPGSYDSNGATGPQMMESYFTWWRNQGAQVAFCVNWGSAHNIGSNQGWEAFWSWMIEVANLRYPRPMAPAQNATTFPTLINLNETSGWLADRAWFSALTTPSTTNVFTPIAPYASYSGTKSTASWLPNETLARLYRAMNSTDRVSRLSVPLHSPLRIVSPAQFTEPVFAGTAVTIEVDPRDFDNTNALASMDFYDGSTWLGAITSGPSWKWVFTPTAGWHTLSVVGTDVLGNKRDAFRTLIVTPSDFPPIGARQSLSATTRVTLSGTVSAVDPEGKSVTYAVAQPAHGTATINASTGAFTYCSTNGYSGTDTFTFTANDGVATSDPTPVVITIALAPVGAITTFTATPGTNTGEIVLTWSEAQSASSYQVEMSSNGGTSYSTVATVNSPSLTTTYTASKWQSYLFRVKGYNASYTGAYSATASSTPYVAPAISNWRLINFGSSTPVAGTSGDLDIPLQDGVTNLMRYALGYYLYDSSGNTLLIPPTNLPYVQEQVVNSAQYLTCTFVHNKNATDLTIKVEVANDPKGPWTQLDPFLAANQVSVTDNTPSAGVETIVVKDTQSISASDKRFMRFRIVRP